MNDETHAPTPDLLALTAELVVVYVATNSIPATELPVLIANVHTTLTGLLDAAPMETSTAEKPTQSQIRKSITSDALISFEDGKSYKTLRRHLTIRGLTPEAYRTKWGLAIDYPMTSAAYSAQRSELARNLGLGRRLEASSDIAESARARNETAPAKRRGRPPGKTRALASV